MYPRDSQQEWKSATAVLYLCPLLRTCTQYRPSVTQIKPLRNALGTIQVLHNLLETNSKRHALFGDTGIEGESLKLTPKLSGVKRWSCRWEAVKAVYGQMELIVKALRTLSSDKDQTTYAESRAV